MSLATEFVVLGLISVIVLYFFKERRSRPKNFPPGPWGLPFIGALPLFGIHPYKEFTKLKAKYGPIQGFYSIGGLQSVGINDYKLIKEVTNDPAFSGRPKLRFMTARSDGVPEGILVTDGRKWQEQKRFTLRKLRDFGFGTRSMETIVAEEVRELVEGLRKETGKPISTQNRFNGAVINALWTIVAGERFQQNDPKVIEIFRLFTQDLSSIGFRTILSIMIPAMANHTPEWFSQHCKLAGPVDKMIAVIEPYIDSHFMTHVPGQPRDFIDTYIDEIKSTEDPSSSFHISHKKSFLFTIFDLFMAGGETTSTTLSWIFLFMARHKHVQEKLHAEIDRVVGNSRQPSLADRAVMPYTEAVIHEVLRSRPLLPATMQATTEDVELRGFRIPKDTLIMLNIYDAHYDPECWGDPENFRPERFLSQDETKFVHHDGFMVFSVGKRVCLGERLARDELFLFTTALFQAFEVSVDPTGPPPSLEWKSVGLMLPLPHKLVLTARF